MMPASNHIYLNIHRITLATLLTPCLSVTVNLLNSDRRLDSRLQIVCRYHHINNLSNHLTKIFTRNDPKFSDRKFCANSVV